MAQRMVRLPPPSPPRSVAPIEQPSFPRQKVGHWLSAAMKGLAMKDGSFKSTCWECSVNCGSIVTVKDGAVVRIGPDPDHPYSKGNFCIKGIRGATGLRDHPDRLLHPMKRTGPRGGGQWSRITWDEALDTMAERFAEIRHVHGARSIVGATSGAYFSRSVITALMIRSMGSPNWMINQDLCGGCRAVSARVTGLDIDAGGDVRIPAVPSSSAAIPPSLIQSNGQP